MTAKKAATARKPEPAKPVNGGKKLLEAIVTVRHLQDFVRDAGGVDKALEAVSRVSSLVALTGGFEDLTAALEIVGRENTPAAAPEQAPPPAEQAS